MNIIMQGCVAVRDLCGEDLLCVHRKHLAV